MNQYDNETTLRVVSNKTHNNKSRHISLRHNYIKRLFKNGQIANSIQNLADPLIKSLASDMIYKTFMGMGLRSIKTITLKF